MPAPAFAVAGTYLTGTTTTSAAIPVPAGVASGDIILVHLYKESTAAVTPPAGFTEVTPTPTTTGSVQAQHLFWKRATGADSGTYSFSWTGSTWRSGSAQRYTGCVASGSPIDVADQASRSTSGSTTPAVSVTTTGPDRLLVFSGTCWNESSWTPPSGFTERVDPASVLVVATAEQAAAGASGSKTATSVASNTQTARLVALLPAATAVDVSDTAPAGVLHGSPAGESVEALSIHVTLDDTASAASEVGSPAGETISVDVSDTVSTGHEVGAGTGESVGIGLFDVVPAGTLVGSPAGESVSSEEPGLPAGGAPFVSLWAVHPDTGVLVRLPHALKVDLSPVRNQAGSFRFSYPAFGANFDLLYERLVEDQVSLELELWVGGRRFNSLGGDVLAAEGDDVAEDSVWEFTGKFFTHRLARALVKHDPADEKGERRFGAATPGLIMETFLNEAHARGTITEITHTTFSSTHDSAGVPWSQNVTMKFTPYGDGGLLTVLQRLVALGLCEGEVDRDKRLLLYNPGGAGRDLTTRTPPVILRRGKDLLESNRRIDVEEAGTDFYATGAEGLYSSSTDATARARWGEQIERAVDSNQIENQGALDAYVQAAKAAGVNAPMELTHGLVFGSNRPAPVSGFRVNDWLYSDVGRGLERVRVAQWVLSQDAGGVTGSVTLNDVIADKLTRLARKLAALADGSAVVGTSQPPPADDNLAPAAPTGVTVGSLAYHDGFDVYATLVVGWNQVTTNSDGTVTDDVAGYWVQWRPHADTTGGWRLGADAPGQTTTSTSFGGVDAGTDVRVRVAAYDRDGNYSAWSDEVIILTETDTTPPAAPSTPTVTPYLGQLKVAWDGLDYAGAVMPADLQFVELHVSTSAAFTPSAATLKDQFSTIAGERVITDLDYGVTYYVRLVAQDRQANRSDPSGTGSAVPTKVVNVDLGPEAVERAAIKLLAVDSAQMNLLAVNDAQFGSGSIGKLTAGTLSVAVTNAGIIRSGTSGQRYELDAAALRFYDSAGDQTVQLNGASNWIMGEIRTALSGTRMVINPGGVDPDEMRFYPSSGSFYARIETRTFSGQALVEFIGGTSRGDGKTGQAGAHPLEGYVRWGDQVATTPHSFVSARETNLELSGPRVFFDIDERYSDGGGVRRFEWRRINSSGSFVAASFLELRWNSGGLPWFNSPNGNCGIVFQSSGILGVVNNAGNTCPIHASEYVGISAEEQKDTIRDARALINPLQVIRNARARTYKLTSDRIYKPPPTDDDPDPDIVILPEDQVQTRVGVLAEELPEVLRRDVQLGDGSTVAGVSLDAQVNTIWGALGQIGDQQIRTVAGRVEVPAGPRLAGAQFDLPITWDETPLEVPTGGVVSVQSAVAWLGRVTALIVPGSLTASGCTVRVRVLGAISPSAGSPIVVEAQALYLFTPPYVPEAP